MNHPNIDIIQSHDSFTGSFSLAIARNIGRETLIHKKNVKYPYTSKFDNHPKYLVETDIILISYKILF